MKLALILCLFFIDSLFISPLKAEWLKQTEVIMGTETSIELWNSKDFEAPACFTRGFAVFQRIDDLMSPYKQGSEVYAVNQYANLKALSVSQELFELLQKSVFYSDLTLGAFDITFASVGFDYDYVDSIKPNQLIIDQKLNRINYKNMKLKNQSILFLKPDMKIDLGGIAKGYSVDLVIDNLISCGVKQAMVSAGGDSRILGDKRGRSWMIGIKHPRKQNTIALKIPLQHIAVSTSGDYERFFIQDGQRFHHILNPKTGHSINHTASVTIIGPDAVTTDALSTSVFIMGYKKGLELVNRLENIDAIIIDAKGKIHYSEGLLDPSKQ